MDLIFNTAVLYEVYTRKAFSIKKKVSLDIPKAKFLWKLQSEIVSQLLYKSTLIFWLIYTQEKHTMQ